MIKTNLIEPSALEVLAELAPKMLQMEQRMNTMEQKHGTEIAAIKRDCDAKIEMEIAAIKRDCDAKIERLTREYELKLQDQLKIIDSLTRQLKDANEKFLLVKEAASKHKATAIKLKTRVTDLELKLQEKTAENTQLRRELGAKIQLVNDEYDAAFRELAESIPDSRSLADKPSAVKKSTHSNVGFEEKFPFLQLASSTKTTLYQAYMAAKKYGKLYNDKQEFSADLAMTLVTHCGAENITKYIK